MLFRSAFPSPFARLRLPRAAGSPQPRTRRRPSRPGRPNNPNFGQPVTAHRSMMPWHSPFRSASMPISLIVPATSTAPAFPHDQAGGIARHLEWWHEAFSRSAVPSLRWRQTAKETIVIPSGDEIERQSIAVLANRAGRAYLPRSRVRVRAARTGQLREEDLSRFSPTDCFKPPASLSPHR